MKILVPVKRVIDYNVKIRVKPDGSGVDLANVKMSMNPFDEIAVEEALRIKEKQGGEAVALTIGPKEGEQQLRTALAMGAERGILVEAGKDLDSLGVAKLMAKVAELEKPDLVIMGKQAVDDDSNQVGQILSAILGWPQATFASKIKIDGATANVTREVDGGLLAELLLHLHQGQIDGPALPGIGPGVLEVQVGQLPVAEVDQAVEILVALATGNRAIVRSVLA